MIGGLPKLKTVGSRRTVQRHRRQRDAEPRASFHLHARGSADAKNRPVRTRILTNLARRAYRRPVTATTSRRR